MSANDTSMLRAKLRKALDNIGKTNGHACPPTESNVDPVLHELFIASEAAAYWKTRQDKAKQDAMQLAGDDLDTAVQSVIDLQTGTSVALAHGQLYTMTADISKPAARLDSRALRNYMQTKLGLTSDVVEQAFDECTTLSAPAKKIKIAAS